MYAIIGASGNVGHITATVLRSAGKSVRAILRSEEKAASFRDMGCDIDIADIRDSEAIIRAITGADFVQIVVPLDPKAKDPAKEMLNSIEALVAALRHVKPKRILVISDYGAHVTHDIGIPTIFRGLEERISKLSGHKILLRSAEHMHGWARAIPAAMESGVLRTFHEPPDTRLPMIAAKDLGLIAAQLFLESESENQDRIDVVHAEGPDRYNAVDVATILSKLQGRSIDVEAIPRSQWKEILGLGMAPSLVDLLIKVNDAQNVGGLIDLEPGAQTIRYGTMDLAKEIQSLVSLQNRPVM